jgi:hypothetical protein
MKTLPVQVAVGIVVDLVEVVVKVVMDVAARSRTCTLNEVDSNTCIVTHKIA